MLVDVPSQRTNTDEPFLGDDGVNARFDEVSNQRFRVFESSVG